MMEDVSLVYPDA